VGFRLERLPAVPPPTSDPQSEPKDPASTSKPKLPHHLAGSTGYGASRGSGAATNVRRHLTFILPAHGKVSFCRPTFIVCPSPCVAHGKSFAVCFAGRMKGIWALACCG